MSPDISRVHYTHFVPGPIALSLIDADHDPREAHVKRRVQSGATVPPSAHQDVVGTTVAPGDGTCQHVLKQTHRRIAQNEGAILNFI